MKKIFFLFLITIFLSGCSKSGKLTIEGTITDAEGKSLVLEMLSSTTKPDTVKLNQKGNFKFTLPAAKAPEYFLLKLDNQSISLAADSNEVIKIKSSFNNFSNDYTVEGSVESEKIKEIVSKGITLKLKMIELDNQLSGKKISMTEYADSVRVAVAVYKEFVLPFIFENPSSAAAYFSIFQKVNGLMIFDSNDKSDYQAFAAVATAWDVYHKESPRTKQLVDFTLNAYRKRKSVENLSKNLENIQEQNYIEIVLPDMKGHDVRLSDQEGNVVLLNFTAYEAEYSGPYNMQQIGRASCRERVYDLV